MVKVDNIIKLNHEEEEEKILKILKRLKKKGKLKAVLSY